jgi:hypothetical protein
VALKKREKSKLQQNKRLRTYHTPNFIIFGDLKELTTGGSGNAKERSMGIGVGLRRRP